MEQGNDNLYENNIFAHMSEGIRPGGLTLTQRLVDYCDFQRGAKAVDVGCGIGTTVQYLCDECGLYASGIDVSAELIAQGKKRSKSLQIRQSDGKTLPFADASMDGVLAECSLSVMSSLGSVLSEMNRILIPGGKLAITDLYIRDAQERAASGHSGGIMTYPEMSRLLLEHGFEVMVFEDQSKSLAGFVASFIMEHGKEELWQCIGLDQGQQSTQRLGYYLLIAEKNA